MPRRSKSESYCVFVKFRRSRLTMRRGIKRLDEALAVANALRAERLHDPGAVFILKEPEGIIVDETELVASTSRASSLDGKSSSAERPTQEESPSLASPLPMEREEVPLPEGFSLASLPVSPSSSSNGSSVRSWPQGELASTAPFFLTQQKLKAWIPLLRETIARVEAAQTTSALRIARDMEVILHRTMEARARLCSALAPVKLEGDSPLSTRIRDIHLRTCDLFEQMMFTFKAIEAAVQRAEPRPARPLR